MKNRIVCLPPGGVTPGMALAADIKNTRGKVLLTAGTVLDGQSLDSLVRRGIEAIFVTVADTRDLPTIGRQLAEAQNRVDYIFRGPLDRTGAELKAVVQNYRRESLQ